MSDSLAASIEGQTVVYCEDRENIHLKDLPGQVSRGRGDAGSDTQRQPEPNI